MARNARYSIRHEDGESDDVAKMTAEEEQEQLKIYVMRVCSEYPIFLSLPQSDIRTGRLGFGERKSC